MESALRKVKNNILMNMDTQKVTLLVLLNLGAAFNTLRHTVTFFLIGYTHVLE